MSFKVTIEVPDAKLVTVLKQLDGLKPEVEHVGEVKANGKAKRMQPNDIVLLDDISKASDGTLSDQIAVLVQQWEKKHGIGTMTHADLLDELSEYSDAPSAAVKATMQRGVIKRK